MDFEHLWPPSSHAWHQPNPPEMRTTANPRWLSRRRRQPKCQRKSRFGAVDVEKTCFSADLTLHMVAFDLRNDKKVDFSTFFFRLFGLQTAPLACLLNALSPPLIPLSARIPGFLPGGRSGAGTRCARKELLGPLPRPAVPRWCEKRASSR